MSVSADDCTQSGQEGMKALPDICAIAAALFSESPTLQNEIIAVQNIEASLNQPNLDLAFLDPAIEEGQNCLARLVLYAFSRRFGDADLNEATLGKWTSANVGHLNGTDTTQVFNLSVVVDPRVNLVAFASALRNGALQISNDEFRAEFLDNVTRPVSRLVEGTSARAFNSTATAAVAAQDGASRSELNARLDAVIASLHRFATPARFSELARTFEIVYAVASGASLSVTRLQLGIHVLAAINLAFEQRNENRSDSAQTTESDLFESSKRVIELLLGDVWSPIRNRCAQIACETIVPRLDFASELPALFAAVAERCSSPRTSWQQAEGCLALIHGVVRRFEKVYEHSSSARDGMSEAAAYTFFERRIAHLPDFIGNFVRRHVYAQVAHSQSCVRDAAVRTVACYVKRAPRIEACCFFQELLDRIDPGAPYRTFWGDVLHAVFAPDFSFPAPDFAESTLALLSSVMKRLPRFRPASSRRDVPESNLITDGPTSNRTESESEAYVLQFESAASREWLLASSVVELDDSSVSISSAPQSQPLAAVTNTTTEAYSEWAVLHGVLDASLMHPASTVRQAASQLYRAMTVRYVNEPAYVHALLAALTRRWKPAQRAILTKLDVQFLTAFRAACTRLADAKTPVIAGLAEIRPSIAELQLSTSAVKDEADTWEFREGRLLAIELIARFMLANHASYTFGTLNTSAAMGSKLVEQDTQGSPDALNDWYTMSAIQQCGCLRGESAQNEGSRLRSRSSLSTSSTVYRSSFRRSLVKRMSSVAGEVKAHSYAGYSLQRATRLFTAHSDSELEQSNEFSLSLSGSGSHDRAKSASFRYSLKMPSRSKLISAKLNSNANPDADTSSSTPSASSARKFERFVSKSRAAFVCACAEHQAASGGHHGHKRGQISGADLPRSLLTVLRELETVESATDVQRIIRECSEQGESARSPAVLPDDSLPQSQSPAKTSGSATVSGSPSASAAASAHSFGSWLKQCYYATVESVYDSHFELRRMGCQLLPHVSELLHFYDISAVSQLVQTYLTAEPSLMTRCVLLTLRVVLRGFCRFQSLLLSDAESDLRCSRCVRQVLGKCPVERFFLRDASSLRRIWRHSCMHYINRPVLDDFSLVSFDTLLLTYLNLKAYIRIHSQFYDAEAASRAGVELEQLTQESDDIEVATVSYLRRLQRFVERVSDEDILVFDMLTGLNLVTNLSATGESIRRSALLSTSLSAVTSSDSRVQFLEVALSRFLVELSAFVETCSGKSLVAVSMLLLRSVELLHRAVINDEIPDSKVKSLRHTAKRKETVRSLLFVIERTYERLIALFNIRRIQPAELGELTNEAVRTLHGIILADANRQLNASLDRPKKHVRWVEYPDEKRESSSSEDEAPPPPDRRIVTTSVLVHKPPPAVEHSSTEESQSQSQSQSESESESGSEDAESGSEDAGETVTAEKNSHETAADAEIDLTEENETGKNDSEELDKDSKAEQPAEAEVEKAAEISDAKRSEAEEEQDFQTISVIKEQPESEVEEKPTLVTAESVTDATTNEQHQNGKADEKPKSPEADADADADADKSNHGDKPKTVAQTYDDDDDEVLSDSDWDSSDDDNGRTTGTLRSSDATLTTVRALLNRFESLKMRLFTHR